MSKMFIGFMLVLLDINLNIDVHTIGLVPDFIGFILLMIGLGEVARESEYFVKIRPWTLGMAVYSFVIYALDISGVSLKMHWIITVILGLAATAATLYISYVIILGIKDTERKREAEINGDALMKTWIPMAVFQVLFIVAMINPLVAIIVMLGVFITAIVFSVQFNKAAALYENLPPLKR